MFTWKEFKTGTNQQKSNLKVKQPILTGLTLVLYVYLHLNQIETGTNPEKSWSKGQIARSSGNNFLSHLFYLYQSQFKMKLIDKIQ